MATALVGNSTNPLSADPDLERRSRQSAVALQLAQGQIVPAIADARDRAGRRPTSCLFRGWIDRASPMSVVTTRATLASAATVRRCTSRISAKTEVTGVSWAAPKPARCTIRKGGSGPKARRQSAIKVGSRRACSSGVFWSDPPCYQATPVRPQGMSGAFIPLNRTGVPYAQSQGVLINASWGGSVARAWTSAGGLRGLGGYDRALHLVAGRAIGGSARPHPSRSRPSAAATRRSIRRPPARAPRGWRSAPRRVRP